MLYTPSFVFMALANLFVVSGIGAFFMFPLFIAEHGGSEVDIGLVMGAASLTSVLFRPWISETIDRIGTIDDAYHEIAVSGSLVVDADGANADCEVYVLCMRVS